MADIYRTQADGSIIELSNWGIEGVDDPDKAMVGRRLTESEVALYHDLKEESLSDSCIWTQMHPEWPRAQMLDPSLLKGPQTTNGQLRVPLRQLTSGMLTRIIEARCGTSLESLSKMMRRDLEALACSLLERNYVQIDLDAC